MGDTKDTDLIGALRDNNTAMVTRLLKEGANPNALTTRGETALMYALKVGRNTSCIRGLLAAGANPNARTPMGVPTLHFAATGQAAALRHLVRSGAELNAKDHWGRTALWIALSERRSPNALALIDAGADPSISPDQNNRRSPLSLAIALPPSSRTKVVNRLLSAGLVPDEEALCNVAQAGDAHLVGRFIELGAPVHATGTIRPPLHAAAVAGHEAVIEVLVDANAPINATNSFGRTALHQAVHLCSKDGRGKRRIPEKRLLAAIKTLLAHGANPNTTDTNGYSVLDSARANNLPKILKLLRPNDKPVPLSPVEKLVISEGREGTQIWSIVYRPNNRIQPFDLVSGHWHDAGGTSCDARVALSRYRDMFERRAPWFLPALKRLAADEPVSAGEIQDAMPKNQELSTTRPPHRD